MILGYDVDGQKDILGLWLSESESKHQWMQIFDEIKSRGVEDVLFVFCKTFLHKIAKTFCRSLQLHFVGNCKPGWQSWYLPAI